MKYLLLVSILSLLNFQSFCNEIIRIDKYVNNQENTIKLNFDYGNSRLLNKSIIGQLNGKTIYHIDFVYSAYKSAPTFNQLNLNEKRISELNRLLPQLKSDSINWSIYEQSIAKNKADATGLFHGFVIHFGEKIDYKSQKSYFSDIQKPFSVIDIDNQKGGRVSYYTGSSIIMEELAVTYENGDTVIGTYQLYYREFRNQAEIALSGIPMSYTEINPDEIFNSTGMFEIIAKKDGKELVLQIPARVNFQCTNILPDVSFFELGKDDEWTHSEPIQFEDPAADEFTETGRKYQISLDGDWGAKQITASRYKPEKFIDQGSFQGYTRIKELMTIDKDKIFIELNQPSWLKFKRLCENPDSTFKRITSEIDEGKKCMLVNLDSTNMFIETIMGQKIAELNVESAGKGSSIYKCSSNSKQGLVNIVGDQPIPPSPALVMGLSAPNFGVYNCDQTKRIEAPVAITPTYFDRGTGIKIEKLYVSCVIDLSLNASLSYHPNHLVCNSQGNNKVLLFTITKEIYLFDENDFKNTDISNPNVKFNMLNITEKIKNSDDLKNVLNL